MLKEKRPMHLKPIVTGTIEGELIRLNSDEKLELLSALIDYCELRYARIVDEVYKSGK